MSKITEMPARFEQTVLAVKPDSPGWNGNFQLRPLAMVRDRAPNRRHLPLLRVFRLLVSRKAGESES